MAIRSSTFAPGEIYHCYNRGVDKRTIFIDKEDYGYFLKILHYFNTSEVAGRLRLLENKESHNPPVSILSYCLLPNHYHLLLQCTEIEGGLSKYMQRIGTGYTMYFNKKYKRSGSLFQGKFKDQHIDSDLYLKHILAYVSHNNIVHNITDAKLFRSYLNSDNAIVRGLASNYSEENLQEVVAIIKELRSSRQGLELV